MGRHKEQKRLAKVNVGDRSTADDEEDKTQHDKVGASGEKVGQAAETISNKDEEMQLLKEKVEKKKRKSSNADGPDDLETTSKSFRDFQLDDRLLKAIAGLGWERPTPIQQQMIPLIMAGKDVVARARTGSGKTGAFALPILHAILERKLAFSHFTSLCSSCSLDVQLLDLSAVKEAKTQCALLADGTDVVMCTPSRLLPHLDSICSKLEHLVMDEADLLLSFGYEKDIRQIVSSLPESCQAMLTSATMSDDIKQLKGSVLKNPVTLKLTESQLPGSAQLAQYHIRCEEEDKFVLIYALFKLRLIRGKTIVFVSNTDRCYRLRLFLEQFGVSSCVLNSEMPVNSRLHIVQQFNEGKFDIVIASDICNIGGVDNYDNDASESQLSTTKKRKRRKMDRESGVSRGIDFHRVANVINFDFPSTLDAYIHRVGRTARGWNNGTALSFATEKETDLLAEVEAFLNEQLGGEVLKPYEFRMSELDGFRYRARDVMRAITSSAVREARLSEIKAEILRSKKLEGFFSKNPRELGMLTHDKALHGVKVHSAAIKDVPEYIVPVSLRGSGIDYAASLGGQQAKKRKRNAKHRMYSGQRKFQKKQDDPLQSFCA